MRARLLKKLNESEGGSLIWVEGPAGSGKTSLISSYAEEGKFPVLWYQLGTEDSNPSGFFFYLGKAYKKARPRARRSIPLLTPDRMGGIHEFANKCFTELFSGLPEGSLIVFDDYQELGASGPIGEILLRELSRVPGHIRACILSRSSPPSWLIRLKSQNRLITIGWEELRFTPEETLLVVQSAMGQSASDELAERLHRYTDGWAAGLTLALTALREGRLTSDMLFSGHHEDIVDYLSSEVFSLLNEEWKDFLTRTAFTPFLSAGMGATISNNPQAGKILEEMTRNNYFTAKHGSSPPLYRYHPLFRTFLRSRALERYADEDIKEILNVTAESLIEDGFAEEAAALFTEAEDYSSLSRLVLENGGSLLSQGRLETLESWIEALPKSILQSNPWLLYWRGQCHLLKSPPIARKSFEEAFSLFRKSRDLSGIFLAWCGVVDAFLNDQSDLKPLGNWIRTLDEIMNEYGKPQSPEIESHVATSTFTALVISKLEHPRFNYWLKKVTEITESCPAPFIRFQAFFSLILHYMWIGELHRGKATLSRLQAYSRRRDAPPLASLAHLMFEGKYFWLEGKFEESLKSVRKYIELSRETGIHIWDHFVFSTAASACADMGNLTEAENHLKAMSHVLETGRIWDISYYHHIASWLAHLKGELLFSLAECERTLKLAKKTGSLIATLLAQLSMARLKRLTDDREESRKHLKDAYRLSRRMKSPLLDYHCRITEAWLNLLDGKEDECAKILEETLPTARKKGFKNLDSWHPEMMTQIFLKALERGIEVDYVQSIIRERRLSPQSAPVHLENWPWKVRIRSLGKFSIEVDDKPLKFSAKASKKPLELLKVLLSFEGREVSRERAADLLWPDSEGDLALQNLATTLHRLRKLLRNEEAIILRGERLSLNPDACWVDAWAFNAAAEELDRIEWIKGDTPPPEELIAAGKKAVELFKGHFLLEDENRQWTTSAREKIRSRFLRCVMTLGAALEELGLWSEATDVYNRGIEIDDLAEEFYQRIMLCYWKMGKRTQGLSIYERCRKVLASNLGIEPSDETEEIRRTLLKEAP